LEKQLDFDKSSSRTPYLEWIQALEEYFETKGLQKPAINSHHLRYFWQSDIKKERANKGRPR